MKKKFIIIGLLFSHISIKAQEKSSTKNDTINLAESIITSSYGTTVKKENVVGAMTIVTDDEIITAQPFESIEKMIAGLVPGLQIVNNSDIGKPVDINIRGLGSMVGITTIPGISNQPLIIIDGIYVREDRAFDVNFFNGGTNAEMNINPLARLSTDNVKSITVLKDAAAVALYGADAANGVILITTKKGQKGKPKYSYSSQYGVSNSINKINYLRGEQYAQLRNDYNINNGTTSGYTWNGVDVDWFDVMNRNSDYFKTNFSMSGGSNHITYRLGVDYSKNNESKINNYLEKKGIDLNIGYTANKFKANLYAAYNNFYKNNPNTYFNFILAPTFSIYDENGNFSNTGTNGIANPLAAANQNKIYTENNSLLSSLNLEYQIHKDIKVSSLFGIDYSYKSNNSWQSPLNESASNVSGRSRISKSQGTKWNWSGHVLYNKDFEYHHIDALIGIELRSTKDSKSNHIGTGFGKPETPMKPWEGTNYTLRTLTLEESGRSTFAQFNYNYQAKYFFTGSIRRDESSSFGKDVAVATNGAAGVAWMISNEEFFKNTSIIKLLKLRASWGLTGNSRIGSYRSAGLYNVYQNGFTYDYDYSYPNTSSPPNKKLSWVKNEKFNIGLDINLFNRIDFTLELYRNNISDMIISRDVPIETGYGTAEINGASMYNQGIESSIRVYWIKNKKIKWNTLFNISTVKNRVTNLVGFGDDYSVAALARAQRIGVSTSTFWGYEWMGVNPENGLDRYKINGKVTDSNQFTATEDSYTIIGNSQPDAIGGIMNSIQVGNFNFSALFNYQIGGDVLVNPELIDQYRVLTNRNMSVNALNYWTITNSTDAQNHIPTSKNKIVANSSKYLYDNTYIKLQNINLSYQLPIKDGTSFIDSASIFVDISNVWYWYKEKSPEGRNGIREFNYIYPEMRTYSMGFRVNF